MIERFDEILLLKCSLQRLLQQRVEILNKYDPQLEKIGNHNKATDNNFDKLEKRMNQVEQSVE